MKKKEEIKKETNLKKYCLFVENKEQKYEFFHSLQSLRVMEYFIYTNKFKNNYFIFDKKAKKVIIYGKVINERNQK